LLQGNLHLKSTCEYHLFRSRENSVLQVRSNQNKGSFAKFSYDVGQEHLTLIIANRIKMGDGIAVPQYFPILHQNSNTFVEGNWLRNDATDRPTVFGDDDRLAGFYLAQVFA